MSDGPPCLLRALMPLELPSCAVGVGSIPTPKVLTGPGEQEHAFAAVCRADVGGADATPERVIPCFGQVAEYTVEASVAPAKRGDVLQHDPVDCTNESIIHSVLIKGDHLTV